MLMCEAEPLNRVFLEIGSLSIYWYGVIIATGLFLGLYLDAKESETLRLQKDIMIELVVFAVPIVILFARIYYVIFEFDAYRGQPWWKFIAVWEGGIAIHGALIGAVLTGIVFAKVKKVSFWQIADIAAPSIILGQAIGRWGNFMNQEAHGGPISQAAYENFHQYLQNFIMDQMCINGVMYYPTFFYESIWNIIVFTILILMRKYNPLRGEIFLSYIALYSVGRVFIEGLRTDSLYFGPLRQAQLLSIVLIVGAIIIIIIRRKSGQIDRKYDGSNISSKKKKRK